MMQLNGTWIEEAEPIIDDASGAILDPEAVKKAREEELKWIRGEQVYERVPAELAQGHQLLRVKWVDINKGDADHVRIRSRLVAREIKRAKPKEMQLGGSDTFSSTPPIEAVYALMSCFMTRAPGDRRKKMANWDISRAHFMGTAERELYLELPEEDRVHPGDQGPMVGRLKPSLYGTQDAAKIFQTEYEGWLKKHGAQFSKVCPSIFNIEQQGLIGVVHGDDFLVVGEKSGLKWMDQQLNARYTARWEATLGDGENDQREMFFLNRLIRYVPDGAGQGECRLEIEADARHSEILVKEFGFKPDSKGCDVPEDKMTEKDLIEAERETTLEQSQITQFRSMVMRLTT